MAHPKYKERLEINKELLIELLNKNEKSIYRMSKDVSKRSGLSASNIQTNASRGKMSMEMVNAVADYLGIDADRLLKKPNRSEVPEESTAAPQEDGQHGPLFEPMKVSSIALRLATKLRNCTLNHILTGIRGLDKNRVIEAYKAKEYGSLMPGEIAVIARYLDIDTDDLTNGEPVPHYYVIVEKHWKEAKQ